MQLSDKVRELIGKAQIIRFEPWQTSCSPDVIMLFQAANAEGRFLSNEDLQTIQSHSPETEGLISVMNLLREDSKEIVDAAKAEILQAFPNITQPGGDLYPLGRSEACWRDLWNFLRCISYGVAGQIHDYTCPKGMEYLHLLYQELDVPLNAMLVGLEAIKTDSLQRIEQTQQEWVAPYFDHLIQKLESFG